MFIVRLHPKRATAHHTEYTLYNVLPFQRFMYAKRRGPQYDKHKNRHATVLKYVLKLTLTT